MRSRVGVVFAIAGGAAGAVGACSSASTGATAGDASTPDAAAPDVFVAPPMEASAPDADDGGADAPAASGDGGCPDDGGIPDDLACTGLYSDWATKTIAPDAVAYTPALVFWSDGAIKTRWLYLPPGTTIDTTDMDNWVFPVGHEGLEAVRPGHADRRDAADLEDVVDVWTYLDYLWSADGSSARRFDDGETNVNGTTYEIPSTSVCSQCHGGRADVVLGIDFLGLGRQRRAGRDARRARGRTGGSRSPGAHDDCHPRGLHEEGRRGARLASRQLRIVVPQPRAAARPPRSST